MTHPHKTSRLELNEQARKQATASLRAYAADNFDEELSDLQATLLLDHILTDVGPAIYNQALEDARRFMEDRAADLDASLQKAEFPLSQRRKR